MNSIALARTWMVGACAAWLAVNASAADAPRLVQSFDENWRFRLGVGTNAIAPGYDDNAWRVVDVPHDYVFEGDFEETNPFLRVTEGRAPNWYHKQGSLPVQPAIYRKALDIPATAQGRRLWPAGTITLGARVDGLAAATLSLTSSSP